MLMFDSSSYLRMEKSAVKPQIQEEQSGFHPDHEMPDQFFNLVWPVGQHALCERRH